MLAVLFVVTSPLHVDQLSSFLGWVTSVGRFSLSLDSSLASERSSKNSLPAQFNMYCRNLHPSGQWSRFGLQQAAAKFALNNTTFWGVCTETVCTKIQQKKTVSGGNKKNPSHRYIIMIEEQSYIGWKYSVTRTCSELLCSVMEIVAVKKKGSKYIHLFWQS